MSSKLATWQHCKFSGLSAFQGAACKRQMCHGNGNGIPRCCDSLRRSWPIFLGWPYLVAFLGRNLCGRLFWFEISFLNLFWIIVWFLVNPGNKVNENGGLKSALFPLCPCSLCFQSWNFCRVTGLRTGDDPPIVMEASDLAFAELLLWPFCDHSTSYINVMSTNIYCPWRWNWSRWSCLLQQKLHRYLARLQDDSPNLQ